MSDTTLVTPVHLKGIVKPSIIWFGASEGEDEHGVKRTMYAIWLATKINYH